MGIYEDQRDALVRTPQEILIMGLRYCANYYTQTVQQILTRTEELDNAQWLTSAASVFADEVAAPDGTITAERVTFNAIDASIEQRSGIGPVTTHPYTGSIWVRTLSGTGNLTLRIREAGADLGSEVTIALTTTWTRFFHKHKFSAGTNTTLTVIRRSGQLGSAYLWGGNLHQNPFTTPDAVVKFPYRKRVSEAATVASVMASRCQATDAGDGARCYYSFPTCQDPANFNPGNSYEGTPALQGIREYRLCLKDAPAPLPGEDVWPLVKSVSPLSQEIDPERAVTVSERVSIEMYDDHGPGLWDQAKSGDGALVNTAIGQGSFWRRLMAIQRNYGNRDCYLIRKRGFVASGAIEADFKQRGRYLIDNIKINADLAITLTVTDRLKLLKTKVPFKISETNLLNGAMTTGQTTMTVDDGTEMFLPAANAAAAAPDYFTAIELDYDNDTQREFVNVLSGPPDNTFTIQRGRWGISAKTHADNVKWRHVLMFGTEHTTPSATPLGKNPIDCVIEILYMGGLKTAEIDIAGLQAQRDLWLVGSVVNNADQGVTFKRAGITMDAGNGGISNQTDFESLLTQIREAIMLDLHINEEQVVTGRLFAPAEPTVTLTALTDEENMVEDSAALDDDEKSRITEVVIAYDLKPDGNESDLDDYLKVFRRIAADEVSAGFYGPQPGRAKLILSPWIRSSDSTTPSSLSAHILGRFRQSSQKVSATLEIKDDSVKVGDYVHLTTSLIQTPSGAQEQQRIFQVVAKEPDEGGSIGYLLADAGSLDRFGFFAPNTAPDYDVATPQDKRYAYWSDAQGRVGLMKDPGYKWW